METSGPFDPPTEPSYFNVDPIPIDWSAARVASYFRENDDAGVHMLSIHEAVPGHYVQLRANNVNPSLVRRIFGNGSFIEGWACFTEGLMIEQGFRPDDSALKLTQLKWRLREATNALLDAEYHAGSLTHDEAIRLMVDGAFQESPRRKANGTACSSRTCSSRRTSRGSTRSSARAPRAGWTRRRSRRA